MKTLVKLRNGQFVKVSEEEAGKLIESGRAVLYDLKTGKHEPFKPLKMERVPLTPEQEKAKRLGKAKTKKK